MLVSMATLILVIVGVVLVLLIVIYGIYITFYPPLTKTVKGGSDAMKERAEKEEKKVTAKKHTHLPPDQPVGKGIRERRKKGITQKNEEM